MATSGSATAKVTNWDTLKFSWWENSQSIENNSTTIGWQMELIATSDGRISASSTCEWNITVDGTKYTGQANVGISNNSTKTLASGTTTIYHNSDGTKTFSYSFSQYFGITFSGNWITTISGSGSGTLDTIPRKSTMSVSNGTLGTAQTLSVTRKATSFTHTITYKCGGSSGTIATKSSSTSISWTPPLALASENTTGTSVSVTLTITTYNGSTSIGANSYTITCGMPASVKPSCKITVTDPTGFLATYGSYIKGQSKFKVEVTPTTSYGSAISTYSVTANGTKYNTASFTTGVLTASGSLTVSATVTDKRGRSGTASVTLAVLDCPPPVISKLAVIRCDQNGTENGQGEYIKVTFSATVTNLDNQNTAAYVVKYKKSTETDYTDVSLSNLKNVFTVTDAAYIFQADSGSSYDVKVGVTDKFTTVERTTSASTAFTIMHWKADGTGMGIGKISELSNLLDIGLKTRFYGGILPPVLEPETDLNDIRTPNTYIGANIKSNFYGNLPEDPVNGTFTLVVESCGDVGQTKQTYFSSSKYKPERYSRFYYQNEWGPWFWASTDEVVLYENDEGSSGTITLGYTLSYYRYIEIYFTDNNGKAGGYTKVYKPDGKTIMLNIFEAASTIYSRQTSYSLSGTTITPDNTAASYVRFTSAGAVSTSIGTNYIKIVRVIGRA